MNVMSASATFITLSVVGGLPFVIAAVIVGTLYYQAGKVYGQTSRDMRRLGIYLCSMFIRDLTMVQTPSLGHPCIQFMGKRLLASRFSGRLVPRPNSCVICFVVLTL
jgi:hypothetical protein